MTIEPRRGQPPQAPQGEGLSSPERRIEMPHDQMDFVLVNRIALGEGALAPFEATRHDWAALETATDVIRLNIESEPSIHTLENQWKLRGASNDSISTEIPKQRPSVLARPEEVAQSLEEGETLAGVIAAATWFEDERRPHARGIRKSRRQGVSNEEIRLNSIANKSIIRGFGFKYRQSRPGPQAAPLLWGRALQLLPGFGYRGASELVLPIGQGLEQSLTLNADLIQTFPPDLRIMATKVTAARDISRTRLPADIKKDIMLSDRSPEDKVAELHREQLDLQRRLLMRDLYPPEPSAPQRPIPHPRRPQ